LLSSLAARQPGISPYASSKRKGEAVLAAHAGQMPWAVLRPPSVYGPGEKEMMPLLRWMTRGIAIVLGSGKGRFSLLYADDLAEAIQKLLLTDDLPKKVFEPHDGHPDGYSWQDVIDAVGRQNGKRAHCLHLPVAGLKIVGKLNLIMARLLGYAPLFTPGKLSLLMHPNWVSHDNALTQKTGWTPHVSLEEGLKRTLEL
jgi:nucleoside-diphosphate-sugar epimerase